jgi:hypothetical protein
MSVNAPAAITFRGMTQAKRAIHRKLFPNPHLLAVEDGPAAGVLIDGYQVKAWQSLDKP